MTATTTDPFSILAVCTANICRSPMIELLLRKHLDGDAFSVGSAGVHGWNRAPVDSMVTLELARLGVRAAGFQSRALNDELIEQADLILVATRDHRAHILGRSPDALRKTFTLLEFATLMAGPERDGDSDSGEEAAGIDFQAFRTPADLVAETFKRRSQARKGLDLFDPYRQGPDIHRAVAEQVRDAIAVIARRLNDSTG